jgi:hypothetical protein
MSTDVNYSIKGTTDVPQQVDKSKNAISEFERQSAAVQKKFTEFGKDFILGFLAPMVLLNSAINFISAAIEARKRQVQEALDFASTAEAKLLASKQEIEAAQRRKDQQKAEEDRKKAEVLKEQARVQFFKEAPEGRAFLEEQLKDPFTGLSTVMDYKGKLDIDGVATVLAKENKTLTPELQAAFDRFFGASAEQRAAKEAEDAAAKQVAKAPQVFAEANATFGVGNSPQMNLLNEQVELQKQANQYLEMIALATKAGADFTKDQTGGMASQVNYRDYTKTV